MNWKMTVDLSVNWDGGKTDWATAKAKAERAKELAKGLNLLTTETRTWYEDSLTETVTNWFGIAMLIDRVKEQAAPKENNHD